MAEARFVIYGNDGKIIETRVFESEDEFHRIGDWIFGVLEDKNFKGGDKVSIVVDIIWIDKPPLL